MLKKYQRPQNSGSRMHYIHPWRLTVRDIFLFVHLSQELPHQPPLSAFQTVRLLWRNDLLASWKLLTNIFTPLQSIHTTETWVFSKGFLSLNKYLDKILIYDI